MTPTTCGMNNATAQEHSLLELTDSTKATDILEFLEVLSLNKKRPYWTAVYNNGQANTAQETTHRNCHIEKNYMNCKLTSRSLAVDITGFYCVDIRKFFVPYDGTDVKPTCQRIALHLYEEIRKIVDTISSTYPTL